MRYPSIQSDVLGTFIWNRIEDEDKKTRIRAIVMSFLSTVQI